MGLEWQVIADGQSWFPWLNRDKFPKEFGVTLPDPSILTKYWLNWRTSMTRPVLSHLVG